VKLSIIIPARNAAHCLVRTISSIGSTVEIIVVDGKSSDGSGSLAKSLGARVVTTEAGRGHQLATGAKAATGSWLLFLHADTVLDANWHETVTEFTAPSENQDRAAVFRFSLDDSSREARRLERWVAWRVHHLGLPYGDQGMLIHRDFYNALGGYRALPLMEDVDLVRRIGKRQLSVLTARVTTSAVRWHEDGWLRRSARNVGCLSLYFLGVPPRVLRRLYG